MTDSRVILDQPGADKLIGQGDAPLPADGRLEGDPGAGRLGTEDEIAAVVAHVTGRRGPSTATDVAAVVERRRSTATSATTSRCCSRRPSSSSDPVRLDVDAAAQAARRLREGRSPDGPARVPRDRRPVRGLEGARRARDRRAAAEVLARLRGADAQGAGDDPTRPRAGTTDTDGVDGALGRGRLEPDRQGVTRRRLVAPAGLLPPDDRSARQATGRARSGRPRRDAGERRQRRQHHHVVRILLAPRVRLDAARRRGADGLLRYVAGGAVHRRDRDRRGRRLPRAPPQPRDRLGKLLDPIADKMLIGGALVALSILGELRWWVTIVILCASSASPSTASRSADAASSPLAGRQVEDLVQAIAIASRWCRFLALSGRVGVLGRTSSLMSPPSCSRSGERHRVPRCRRASARRPAADG